MKILINKANPQIRITAPEIGKVQDSPLFESYYTIKEGDSVEVCLSEPYWTLVEEEPMDLEKAAEEYADKHGFRIPYDGSNNFYDDVDVKASLEGFKAGARWMEEQGETNNYKPTKEQIEYLSKAIYILGEEGDCRTAAVLNELRKDLKKL